MRALRIYAGPKARRHIESNGLRPGDVGVVPAAAGGPKGLILGPLDRILFGAWLADSSHPVHLVGASIGAWRMATACLQQSVAPFERLERDYIAQDYELPPGRKTPTAAHVTERFGQSLQAFYGGRVQEVLRHDRFKLHIVTSRGRHVLARWAGDITYGTYLLHPILFFGFSWLGARALTGAEPTQWSVAARWLLLALVLAAATVLAIMSDRWLERPLRNWGQRKLRGGVRAARPQSDVASISS